MKRIQNLYSVHFTPKEIQKVKCNIIIFLTNSRDKRTTNSFMMYTLRRSLRAITLLLIYWGELKRAPHKWFQSRFFCLYIYICIYMCHPSFRISLSSISTICNISINDLQLIRMCDDTQHWLNVTVQKKFYSMNQHGVSATKERRLQHRRERERAHWAAETAAEKEERLRKRRKRDQERRVAEIEEQRAASGGYRENVPGVPYMCKL